MEKQTATLSGRKSGQGGAGHQRGPATLQESRDRGGAGASSPAGGQRERVHRCHPADAVILRAPWRLSWIGRGQTGQDIQSSPGMGAVGWQPRPHMGRQRAQTLRTGDQQCPVSRSEKAACPGQGAARAHPGRKSRRGRSERRRPRGSGDGSAAGATEDIHRSIHTLWKTLERLVHRLIHSLRCLGTGAPPAAQRAWR